jgi:hypothetical protein
MADIHELTYKDIDQLLERLESGNITEEDIPKIAACLRLFKDISIKLENREVTLKKLRKIIFGIKSEKTDKVIDNTAAKETSKTEDSKESNSVDGSKESKNSKEKRKGHGRNGASKYPGATVVHIKHNTLKSGDECPAEDCEGKLYERKDKPGIEIRLTGHAPFSGTVYKLQRLRCNFCQTEYKADLPKDAGEDKYDETAASVIGTLKYGYGLPFNRLDKLQNSVGIPLPSSTQWDIVDEGGVFFVPVFEEFIRQSAQGELFHNDDTTVKILELIKENKLADKRDKENKRKGMFTSGIISLVNDQKIALFFTGRNHAGENLADVLKHRAAGLSPPIQMCDALDRNLPKGFEVILANCNAHYPEFGFKTSARFSPA